MDSKTFYNLIQERTEWFREARFGAFIHFGLYSIPARGEWVRSVENITIEDYQQYFEEFNPVDFDARQWARTMKDAGMKYAILTSKHHDGFCLFDSKLTDYKVTNTPFGRDIIKEYVEAMREEGLKVGIYYSLPDWHHEDYPAYGDRQHPMRNNEEWKDKKHNFSNYVDYLHGQVKELCTNYGKIDMMWFDFSYWDKKGEAWRATELVNMIRELQPGIVINNRLGGDMESPNPEVYAGDFDGPEQCVPKCPILSADGQPLPWELCMTLNGSWGYCATNFNFKSPQFVVKTLVDCVSKNGNLMLNIGPNAKGVIPKETADVLAKVGEWLRENGDSVYGCGISEIPSPNWGIFTQKGKNIYAHMFTPCIGHMNLSHMKDKVKKARLIRDESEVILTEFWNANNGVSKMDDADDIYLALGQPVQDTFNLPDPIDTVIRIELK